MRRKGRHQVQQILPLVSKSVCQPGFRHLGAIMTVFTVHDSPPKSFPQLMKPHGIMEGAVLQKGLQ